MKSQEQAPQVAAPEVSGPEAGQEAGFEQERGNGALASDLAINTVPRDASDGDKPMQHHGDLDKLYQEAAVAMVALGGGTEEIAGTTGGKAKIPDELKGRPRAMEKVANDYKGNAAKLCDIARASIFYDDMAGVERGKAEVEAFGGWKVVHAKDRFESPLDGYRDFTFLVAVDGHVCELQLHLTKVIEAKKKGHEIYERVRTLKGQLEKDKSLSRADTEELEASIAKMWTLYNNAFLEAGGTVTDAERAKEEFGA